MDAPDWGDDWAEVRALWDLDPEIAHLNHGSWGATPLPVLAAQSRLRTELERDPVDFLLHTIDARLAAARQPVAALLGADPDDLAFVTNATAGMQTVLSSIEWRPGDEVVVTDHAYPAVRHQLLEVLRRRHTVVVTEVPVDLPGADLAEVAATVSASLTERTRLLVVDHIASASALLFPVGEIAAAARALSVPVLVDAAHAPGQLPVDLATLGVDWWVGNLHKWCCAPKGSAVLWAARHRRDELRPLVTSHGLDRGFRAEFDWSGTADPTAALASADAIGLLAGLGWDRLRAYQHALSAWGADLVAGTVGSRAPLAPAAHAAMTLVDPGRDLTEAQAEALHWRLFEEHRIQVPLTWWRGRAWLRLSAHAYNEPDDYARLAAALPTALRAR